MKKIVLIFLLLTSIILNVLPNTRNTPIKAVLGLNYSEHINSDDCWFEYTPKHPTYLVISSCDETDEDTYCEIYYINSDHPIEENDDACDAQSSIRFIAEKDSTYLIRWRGIYAKGDYSWKLEEENIGAGEHATTAIEIGKNHLDIEIPPKSTRWYKYTSNDYEVIELYFSRDISGMYFGVPDHYFNLYYNSIVSYDSKRPYLISTVKGEVYYFKLFNFHEDTKQMFLEIQNTAPESGETFYLARELVPNDTTIVTYNGLKDHWYHFKSDSSGYLIIDPIEKGPRSSMTVLKKQSNEIVDVIVEEVTSFKNQFKFRYEPGVEYVFRLRLSNESYFYAREHNFYKGESQFEPINIEQGVYKIDFHWGKGLWYRYIPDSSMTVNIVPEYFSSRVILQIYDEESGNLLSDYLFYDFNDEGKIEVKVNKGKAYLFYIGKNNYIDDNRFLWDLRENLSDCASPEIIDDQITVSGNTEYWFKYVTKNRCKLDVSTSNLNNGGSVDISMYKNCDSLLDLRYGLYLYSNDTILIRSKGYDILNEYKILVNETPLKGGVQQLPVLVSEGSYVTNTLTDTWYKFIPRKDGKVVVDLNVFADSVPKVWMYKYVDDVLFGGEYNTKSHRAAIKCNAGIPVYIRFYNNDSEDSVTWVIKEHATEPGDEVRKALEARSGINTSAKLNSMPSYYFFVPSVTGEVIITSYELTDQDTYLVVVDSVNQKYSSLRNDDYLSKQSYIRMNCYKNDTLYLIWREYNITDAYSWKIEEYAFEKGDHKENPLDAYNGINHCDFSVFRRKWFQYTPGVDGYLNINNCNLGPVDRMLEEIRIYKDDSSVYSWSRYCGENQFNKTIECKKGATYYIYFKNWNNDSTHIMDWRLTEIPYKDGENCIYPISVDQGPNISDSDTRKWFSYTAKENSEITISCCEYKNGSHSNLQVYKECNNQAIWTSKESCDYNYPIYTFQAYKDTTYILFWDVSNYDDNISWNLTETPFGPHGRCEDCKQAIEGNNVATHTDYGDLWYTYTAPEDGELDISIDKDSEVKTRLELYSGCPDEYNFPIQEWIDYYYNSSRDHILKQSCSKGSQFRICFRGDSVKQSYSWNLIYRRIGDYEDLPINASLGTNTRTGSNSRTQYFLFENDSANTVYEIIVPKKNGRKRTINVSYTDSRYNDGIEIYDDSTKATMITLQRRKYLIELMSEPSDTFDFSIIKRDIHNLNTNESVSRHSEYKNDWYKLGYTPTNYYTINSVENEISDSEIELYSSHGSSLGKKEIISSNIYWPIYELDSVRENYVKWIYNQYEVKNWSIAPLKVDRLNDCRDARLAQLGTNRLLLNAHKFYYKLRINKTGKYILSGTIPDSVNAILDIYLYYGDCKDFKRIDNLSYNKYNEHIGNQYEIELNPLINTYTYYLLFNFSNYRGVAIYNFEWNLEFDSTYTEKNYSDDILVFENPNNGKFNISFTSLKEDALLSIYSLTGNIVCQEIIGEGEDNHYIDISDEPNGIYVLSIKSEDSDFQRKIISLVKD
ncbi:T9SS type A sorting domain-containing protein [Saccharicrinis sp. FJH2]|uniref:T9SS type A sorting domain-containing protein n=1 Tax=Saccharicrinis sp. FJH65 TaxID=3344659 RepID=UPI0035F234AB